MVSINPNKLCLDDCYATGLTLSKVWRFKSSMYSCWHYHVRSCCELDEKVCKHDKVRQRRVHCTQSFPNPRSRTSTLITTAWRPNMSKLKLKSESQLAKYRHIVSILIQHISSMKSQHLQRISEIWSVPVTVETSKAYYLQSHIAAPPKYSTRTRASHISDATVFCFISLWPTGAVNIRTKVDYKHHIQSERLTPYDSITTEKWIQPESADIGAHSISEEHQWVLLKITWVLGICSETPNNMQLLQ